MWNMTNFAVKNSKIYGKKEEIVFGMAEFR